MANSNVNIGNRLFAYIAHSADVNTYITTQYNNSMLFIGDEQQIYVPAMGAYVGIGMTAYNNTMNFVLDVNDKLTELEKALKSSMVSKIYPQWNNKEFGGAITNMTYLTQEITIKGIGDYDPATGFSYTSYTVTNATGNSITQDVKYTNNKHYASSGISVTYYSTPAQTNSDGSITPGENYIVIDDKLTWSYIANAYTYSMNFAKKYTATEVERLYHNLLGDGDINNAYLPADFHEAFIEVIQNPDDSSYGAITPDTAKYHVLNNADGRKYWYKLKVTGITLGENETAESYVKTHDTVDGFEKEPNGTITFWKWTEYVLEGASNSTATNAISKYAETAHTAAGTDIQVPQLYIYSDEYNYTYNINISDGIQTLKEVAYLLDVLTDGLGELTYISHAEYAALGENTTGYYRVIGTAYSTSNYAYYFKQNPENLGLQMAYSLASLKIDTNDLHNHTNWLEDGATTLRSVVAQGSKFANVSIDGQHKVKLTDHNIQVAGNNGHFEDGITTLYAASNATRTQTGDEENNARYNWSGNSYTLGDADIRLKLDLTQTYMTVETKLGEVNTVSLNQYKDIYGTDAHFVTIGGSQVVLQAADMAQIIPSAASYYTIAADPNNADVEIATLVGNPETNVHNQNGLQYYWQPNTGAIQEHYINTKFKKVDDVYIANNSSTDFYIETADITTSTLTGLTVDGTAKYVKLTQAQALTANSKGVQVYIIKTKQVGANTVLESEAGTIRPVIDNRDAIATASWVASYLTAAISGLGDQFDDILEEAKRYTDQKIDELDSESLYSDFGANVWDAWCAANISGEYKDSTGATHTGAGTIIFNSSDYKSAKTEHYEYYKNTDASAPTAPSTQAKRAIDLYGENGGPVSLYNKQYSEYVYSTVEENGIVKTETRELPVDRISSRTEIWGTNSSTVYQRTFAALSTASITDDLNGDPDVSSADANDKLFAFVSTKTYDNNIYVQTANEFEYVPAAAADYSTLYDDTANYGPSKLFFVNSKNGKFVAIADSEEDWHGANFTVTSIDGIHAPRFVQLYTRTPKYAEVDLETIVWANDYSKIIGCYAEGVEYTDADGLDLFYIPGENNTDGGTTDPRVNKANKQYISTHYKHYSATSTTHGYEPGHGENEFEVVTYITNLEDATKNNTGLADAYDVKTFVENFFNWVDVSATVTQDNIETNVAWYDKISFYKYNSAATKPTLYWYNSGRFVAVETPSQAYAADQPYTDEHGEETVNGVQVKGPAIWGDPDPAAVPQHTYTGWVMGSTAPGAAAASRQTYYVLNSQAKTNNVNLTLTKYTTKVINWTDRVN